MAFGTQPVVYVEDQYGNLETGDNTTQVTAASLPIGSGPLQGTTTVTASGGVATFTDLADNMAETITIQFTSSPVLTASDVQQYRDQPGGGEPVGNPHPTFADSDGRRGLQPAAGRLCRRPVRQPGDRRQHDPGHGRAGLGTGPLLGNDNGDGHRAASPRSRTWRTTRPRPSRSSSPARRCSTAATSNNIVVSPAAASQLVISTQPSPTATAGMAFSTQPVVYIEDQYGNLVTGDNTTQVTATSLPMGSGPLQGTTTVTASGGIATFTNLADDNGRDDHDSVHQLAGGHHRDFQQHRGQPGSGDPVGDRNPAFVDSDRRRGLQHAARDLHRRPVRQP